jgi:hypothetical protein
MFPCPQPQAIITAIAANARRHVIQTSLVMMGHYALVMPAASGPQGHDTKGK